MRILFDTTLDELDLILEALAAHRDRAMKQIDKCASEGKLKDLYDRYQQKVKANSTLTSKIEIAIYNERKGL